MAGTRQSIKDEGTFNKYFTIMLNMADDDLDPYEYRLLAHYQRVCGADHKTCYEQVATTAQITRMSAAKVRTTRDSLAAKGYLSLDTPPGKSVQIAIVDRMAENIARYTDDPSRKHKGSRNDDPSRKHEATPHENMRPPLTDSRVKEELYKKEPSKKNIFPQPTVADALAADIDETPIVSKALDAFKETQAVKTLSAEEPDKTAEPTTIKESIETPTPVPPPPSPRVLTNRKKLTAPDGFTAAYSDHADGRHVAHLFKSSVKQPGKCVKCHASLDTWSQMAGDLHEYAPCCDWFAVDPTWSQEVKDALAKTCKKDWSIPAHKKAMNSCLASVSQREPVTVEKLRRFYANWYKCYWKGKQGESPEPYEVTNQWIALTESDDCKEQVSNGNIKNGRYQPDDYGYTVDPLLSRD